MRVPKTPLILITALFFFSGGQQLLLAEEEAASNDSGGLFDLFGRKIDPETAAVDGEMPAGPLKIVIDKTAPKFGSKKRRSRSSGSRSRPSTAKKIQWTQQRPGFVNSGGGKSNEATHLVKSGRRVYLKSY